MDIFISFLLSPYEVITELSSFFVGFDHSMNYLVVLNWNCKFWIMKFYLSYITEINAIGYRWADL